MAGNNRQPYSRNFYDRYFFDHNPKLQLVDKISNVEYIVGVANPGSKETDLAWEITKYIFKDDQPDRAPEIYPAQGGATNLRWIDRLESFIEIPTDGSPYDIILSNYTLIDGTGAGATVAIISTLSSDPARTHTYEITEDPNNKFDVSGDQLQLTDTVLLADGSYNIVIKTTDDLGRSFEQNVFLVVIAVPQFSDNVSVVFNGIDQYMRCPLMPEMFSGENKWSWSVWLDPSDPAINDGNAFFGIYVDDDNYFSFGFEAGQLRLKHRDGGNPETVIEWASDPGLANYILVMDYDQSNTASQFNLYKNGSPQLQASNNQPAYTTAPPIYFNDGELWIGRDPSNPEQYQYLRMNDLSVWNKALSPTDAGEIYGTGQPNDLYPHTSSDFLRGWWTFEQGGADDLGLHNCAVINNGPSVYDPVLQQYIFINGNRLSDEIIGDSTPLLLDNDQWVVEVTVDNDQYLTEYIKYSGSQIRAFDLTQEDKFQEFIDQKFKRATFSEVASLGLGEIKILTYTVGAGLKSDLKKVQCTGCNKSTFRATINGSTVGKANTYYTEYNAVIDLEGETVEDGDIIEVYADNRSNSTADFSARLNYEEYLL
jgi:hypothetical protein